MDIILEPLQKWQLPTEIASMSTSVTAWSHAAILGTNGQLFTWNPVGDTPYRQTISHILLTRH